MHEEPRVSVLIVDDDAGKRLALKAALAPLNYSVVEADSGVAALRSVMTEDFAVILLDVRMEGMDGFETAALIRERRQSEMTPIIFITAYAVGEMEKPSLYANGAVDFLFAPVAPEELRGKVSAFAQLFVRAANLAARAARVQTSADHLMLLTDAAPIGIFQTDSHDKLVYTNPRWSELTGMSAESVTGVDWESLIRRGGWRETTRDPSTALPTLTQSRCFEIGRPGDKHRVVLMTREAIPANGGGVSGWVGTLADVTAEAEAEAEKARFRSLVQNSQDVIAIIDSAGTCTYVSPGVAQVGGYDREDVIGRSGFEFIHPDDQEAIASHLAEIVVSPDENKSVEVRTRKKGTEDWIWIEIRAVNRLDDPSINGIVVNYHDITKRRDAMRDLAQSEKSLAQGQALSHLGSFARDLRTGHVEWSDEMFRLLGYEPRSVEAGFEAFLDRIHRGDRGAFVDLTASMLSAGGQFESDLRIVWADGTIRWVHARVEVTLEDGVPVRLLGMAHDFTDRRESENERRQMLAQQEHLAMQLRLLLDSTDYGIYGLDGTGVCTFMNKAGAAMLGGKASDFVGHNMHVRVHHSHPDGSEYPVDDCPTYTGLLTGQPTSVMKDSVWRLDGTLMPVEISSYPIGDDRSSDRVVVTFKDLTQQQELENDLQRNEQLFRGAFDAAQTGIALIAADGLTYVDVNEALCEMLGYTKEELLLLDWAQITHPEDLARNRKEFGEVLAGRRDAEHISKRYLRKDGECVSVEIIDTVIKDSSGDHMYFVTHVNNVTDRERSAADKERLEAQLRQAQKMEAIGQLAGGVAHDFNNILAVVLNYAEFVSETLVEDHEGQADLQQIVKAGERGAELVHQLLAFSRQEVIQPRVIDLNEVVGGMSILLDRSVGEAVKIVIDADADLHLTKADHGQLEQVLLNLIVNARDAMPEGGDITIATRNAEVTDGEFLGLEGGSYVCLTVSDTGGGIDEDTLEHMFEPFFTTKPRGEGTGLGLATAYGIVKRAKGGIYAESTSEGTTFSLFLPETDEDEPEAVEVVAFLPSDRGARVLVVEDERAVQELIGRILRRDGFEVLDASSGADAVEICKEDPGVIDLLLTDVVMPEMSGPALRDLVRPLRPEMSILFMSGYTDELVAKKGVLEAGESLLSKPFNSDQLLTRVRQALHPSEPDDLLLEVAK